MCNKTKRLKNNSEGFIILTVLYKLSPLPLTHIYYIYWYMYQYIHVYFRICAKNLSLAQ